MVRTEDRNCSRSKFEVQHKPRFKRKFSNQDPSNAPNFNKSKVSTLIPKRGNMVDHMLRSLTMENVISDMMLSA